MIEENKRNTMGLVSLILSIVSIFIGWIPFLGWGVIVAALICGIIGLNSGLEKGKALAGVVISTLVLFANVLFFLVGMAFLSEVEKELEKVEFEMNEEFGEVEEVVGTKEVREVDQVDKVDKKVEVEEKVEEKIKEYKIGALADFEGKKVKVNKVERTVRTLADGTENDFEHVVVTVTIINETDENISYNPIDFKMSNSKGEIEDRPSALSLDDFFSALYAGELAPGEKISGTLTFEQPIGDPELKLLYTPTLWEGETIAFNLQ